MRMNGVEFVDEAMFSSDPCVVITVNLDGASDHDVFDGAIGIEMSGNRKTR